jgi:nitrogen-specific signal transduction histidine kinase
MDGTAYLPFDGDQVGQRHQALLVAEAEWRAAISALAQLMNALPRPTTTEEAHPEPDGLALSGPLPVLNQADFGHRLATWVITPQPLADALNGQHALMPAANSVPITTTAKEFQVLPARIDSTLMTERFCLVAHPTFSVGLVLGQPVGDLPCLQYSFDPQVLLAMWQHIQTQLTPTLHETVQRIDQKVSQAILTPDYRLITQFSQRLLAHLPHRASDSPLSLEERGNVRLTHWVTTSPESRFTPEVLNLTEAPPEQSVASNFATSGADTELLQAMAHEIRTPLTTIRTLTRSLLRREDVSPAVKKRLSQIDQECTQQIDRFNLIFRAVELETMRSDRPRSAFAPIALTQIFQEAIPRWQQQAQRRNLNLRVTLPPHLPRVNSDPTLIHEVLTGVVEWYTQCLPPQSDVHMRVMLAGHQLKLQFEAEPHETDPAYQHPFTEQRAALKSVGQLLMIAPETGGLSLNLNATKSLFEFLGGKLILRQRPKQGEVLTAFLPLDTREV